MNRFAHVATPGTKKKIAHQHHGNATASSTALPRITELKNALSTSEEEDDDDEEEDDTLLSGPDFDDDEEQSASSEEEMKPVPSQQSQLKLQQQQRRQETQEQKMFAAAVMMNNNNSQNKQVLNNNSSQSKQVQPSVAESANDVVYKALMEHKKAEAQRMTTLASDTRTITEAMLRKQVGVRCLIAHHFFN